MRFDGRVAVVTGGGRGIGRSYSRLLAERGAQVVVNDLGGSAEGVGADATPALAVAAEIAADGGTAIADSNDISTPEGAGELVKATLDAYGQIDILIANAGIMRWAGPPEVDAESLASHIAVHVGGSFGPILAAWPHFVGQGYGRIVLTTSTGMLGLPNNTSYATAKGGVVGLMRSVASAGRRHGILANAIAPAAMTRLGGPGEAAPEMAPDLVAPMAAYLAHESCPVTGEIYTAGFGRFARLFIASTEGYVHDGSTPTIEDVAHHWNLINDEAGYYVPTDLTAWSAAFMAHMDLGGD